MYAITSGNVVIYGERLAVALGFVTLLSAVITLASCRSCLGLLKLLHLPDPLRNKIFQNFYKYHGYYWWLFITALFLHLTTALFHIALPVPGDPDALIHWVILGFALGALMSLPFVLVSCRSFSNIIRLFTGKSPLVMNWYEKFYTYHSYFWWILLLAFIGHFSASYIHIGFWP